MNQKIKEFFKPSLRKIILAFVVLIICCFFPKTTRTPSGWNGEFIRTQYGYPFAVIWEECFRGHDDELHCEYAEGEVYQPEVGYLGTHVKYSSLIFNLATAYFLSCMVFALLVEARLLKAPSIAKPQ